MAISIDLDTNYIEEFSLASTQRFIRNSFGEWIPIEDDEEIVYVWEE